MFSACNLNLSDRQAKIIDKLLSLAQDNLTAIRQTILTSKVPNTILPPQIVLEKRLSQHHVRQNSLSIVFHRQKLFWRALSLGKPSVIDYTSLSTHRGFVNCQAPCRWWVVPSPWPDLGHSLFTPFTCFYCSLTILHQGCDLQRTLNRICSPKSDCPLQSVTQSGPLRSYLACPQAWTP